MGNKERAETANRKKPVRRARGDKAGLREDRKKLLTRKSAFAIRESYIQLRTNLMYSMASVDESECRVFGVTSPNPEEGKSLTACNIAIAFAMLDKPTLLLDCDMRDPSIARLWRIRTRSGLSDLLADEGTCRVFGVEGLPLSILPVGRIPLNPSEMLASAAFQGEMEAFRRQYAYIIIDLPPVNEVADAQIVSRLVDGMVLVVRSGSTKQRELVEAENALESAGSRVCGVVVNDIDPKTGGRYGYSYGYRHGYRYDSRTGHPYGYGSQV